MHVIVYNQFHISLHLKTKDSGSNARVRVTSASHCQMVNKHCISQENDDSTKFWLLEYYWWC